MQINKDAKYVIGVDLGGTNVRAAVVDRQGKIVGEGRTDSKAMEGLESTIVQIIQALRIAIADANVTVCDVAGVGMGVPGTHKSEEGIVVWCPNFKDWNGVQLLAPIVEEMGMPAFMGNDANVAALGEYAFGAGRNAKIHGHVHARHRHRQRAHNRWSHLRWRHRDSA